MPSAHAAHPAPPRPVRSLSLVLALALSALPGAFGDEPGIAPRRFTFPKQEATLAEVVGALERQTNLSVDLRDARRDARAAFEFRDTPFWEALESIAAKTGHRIRVAGERGTLIALRPAGNGARPSSSVDG